MPERTTDDHRRRASRALATVSLAAAVAWAGTAAATGPGFYAPTPWGQDTAAGRCVVCHSLEEGGPFRYAPNLFGIVGAPKARDEGYGYSLALFRKGGNWTEADLDAYLANAAGFAPGTKKSIRVGDAAERREIIAFLKTLRPAEE